jgi:uncharacterized membrane protein YccC
MAETAGRLDRPTFVDALVSAAAVVTAWYLVVPLGHLVLDDADAEIAGMWSVVAAAFVLSDQVRTSGHSFAGRLAATLVSSVLCFAYLLLLPFSAWGIALVVGVGVIVLAALGLQAETVTTSITSAVVLVVAGIDGPERGWEDPLIRVAATVIGGVVGIGAAWCVSRLRPRRRPLPRS